MQTVSETRFRPGGHRPQGGGGIIRLAPALIRLCTQERSVTHFTAHTHTALGEHRETTNIEKTFHVTFQCTTDEKYFKVTGPYTLNTLVCYTGIFVRCTCTCTEH